MISRWGFGVLAGAALVLTVGREAMAQENCPQGHCGNVAAIINKFCIDNGIAGKPFLVMGPTGAYCYCPCSCVTPDTLISYADEMERPVGDSLEGDMLHSPLSEDGTGRLDVRLKSEVKASPVLRLRFSNGATIVSSHNHPFVLSDEIVASAATLSAGDIILDGNLRLVRVIDIEKIPAFTGELHNLIVNRTSTSARDHLVATNGILSGDWLLQANNDQIEQSINLRVGTIALFDEDEKLNEGEAP